MVDVAGRGLGVGECSGCVAGRRGELWSLARTQLLAALLRARCWVAAAVAVGAARRTRRPAVERPGRALRTGRRCLCAAAAAR